MESIETTYVNHVYSKIARHFSSTRNGDKWQYVSQFMASLPSKIRLIDIGCGNGKYIDCRRDIEYVAYDNCAELLECARETYQSESHVFYLQGSITKIPFEDGSMDAFICIAVFHHLYEKSERYQAMEEMVRILKVGGRGMITVWSSRQNPTRFQKWKPLETSHDPHDYLVPWTYRKNPGVKGVNQNKNLVYYDRYYHVYDKDELLSYCMHLPIHIESCEEIHGNWVLVIQKM